MRVDLSYGRGTYPVELRDEWSVTVIRKPAMPVLADPAGAVEAALAAPYAARPLAEEARGARSACIVICDITRPVPNGLLLPVILRQLLGAGLAPESIRVLIATGLHRPNEGEELRGAGGRSLGASHRTRGESLCAQRRRSRPHRHHARGHRGQARPPLRRGRPEDRDRPGRAAFHGRLLRRTQGHRAGHRASRHHHHLPQRALHVRSMRGQLRARGQSAAPRAARDRVHARQGAGGQHRHRRASAHVLRELWRSGAKPPGGGAVHRTLRTGTRCRAGSRPW